mgnify:CR=1 FL=1
MIVQQILKSKADTGVLTLRPGALVSDAVAVLSEKRIGTIVVSEGGQTPDGILSERDIVRELGKRGAGCMNEPVGDLVKARLSEVSMEKDALQGMIMGH